MSVIMYKKEETDTYMGTVDKVGFFSIIDSDCRLPKTSGLTKTAGLETIMCALAPSEIVP